MLHFALVRRSTTGRFVRFQPQLVALLLLAIGGTGDCFAQARTEAGVFASQSKRFLRPGVGLPTSGDELLNTWSAFLQPTNVERLMSFYCLSASSEVPGQEGLAFGLPTNVHACSGLRLPLGLPDAKRLHLRLMSVAGDPFALVLLMPADDAAWTRMTAGALQKSLQQTCQCLPDGGEGTTCHCASLEVRMVENRKALGVMVIDDHEALLEHLATEGHAVDRSPAPASTSAATRGYRD